MLNDLSGESVQPSPPKPPAPFSQPPEPPTPPQPPKPEPSPFKITKYPYLAEIRGNIRYNKTMISRKNKFVIGRGAVGCSYVISDPKNLTGRTHCYIRFDGTNLYLCDTSSNGTYLENGTRLKKNTEYKVTPGTKFYTAIRQYMFVVDFN